MVKNTVHPLTSLTDTTLLINNGRPIKSVLGLVLFASNVMWASDASPVSVRTARVASSSQSRGKAFVGTIEPARRSVIGTAVAGRIDQVNVETGDLVDKSGVLAQLRLTNIRIRLAAAKADFEVSKQELAELVAGPRKEDLRRLEARVKGAEALLNYANKKFERLASLSERGATARGDLDEALSGKLAAEQQRVAAMAEHDAAIAGTRNEQLAQARAKMAKWEEEVNRIQDELNEHTIRAPFKGFIVKRLVEQGEWLSIGDPVAEMLELDPAEIRLAVPERFISRVRQGQKVSIDVEAIAPPGKPASPLTGVVFRIVPDADARSRSFPVRVRIDNPITDRLPLLKPGMSATVYLSVDSDEQQLFVPGDALVLDRDRAFVFIVKRDNDTSTVQRIEVTVGATRGSTVQVKPISNESIQLGAEVVTEGNEQLESGQSVHVVR